VLIDLCDCTVDLPGIPSSVPDGNPGGIHVDGRVELDPLDLREPLSTNAGRLSGGGNSDAKRQQYTHEERSTNHEEKGTEGQR
jgi:hypothetical protein